MDYVVLNIEGDVFILEGIFFYLEFAPNNPFPRSGNEKLKKHCIIIRMYV